MYVAMCLCNCYCFYADTCFIFSDINHYRTNIPPELKRLRVNLIMPLTTLNNVRLVWLLPVECDKKQSFIDELPYQRLLMIVMKFNISSMSLWYISDIFIVCLFSFAKDAYATNLFAFLSRERELSLLIHKVREMSWLCISSSYIILCCLYIFSHITCC